MNFGTAVTGGTAICLRTSLRLPGVRGENGRKSNANPTFPAHPAMLTFFLSPYSPELISRSLKDCANRLRPYWEQVVKRDLREGKKVLIVSHANTLRSLIKEIDDISDEDIKGMSIPTGIPLLYRLDANLKPVLPSDIESKYGAEPRGYTSRQTTDYGFNGVFIGDTKRLELIQSKRDLTNRDWQR